MKPLIMGKKHGGKTERAGVAVWRRDAAKQKELAEGFVYQWVRRGADWVVVVKCVDASSRWKRVLDHAWGLGLGTHGASIQL